MKITPTPNGFTIQFHHTLAAPKYPLLAAAADDAFWSSETADERQFAAAILEAAGGVSTPCTFRIDNRALQAIIKQN